MEEVRDLKRLLHACADGTRLRILRLLADGSEMSVSDLTVSLRISQPLVSWHLRILRKSGLIVMRRIGRLALYRLHRPGWEHVKARMDQFLSPGGLPAWEAEPARGLAPLREPALREPAR